MKKHIKITTVLILLISLFTSLSVTGLNAKKLTEQAGGCTVYVHDNADLLNETQMQYLVSDIRPYCDEIEFNVLFLTTDDTGGKSTMTYSDDYMDDLFTVDSDENNIGFIIDMDNREVYINTMGGAIYTFSDSEIDDIIDEGYPFLKDGDYYNCLSRMGTYAMHTLQTEDPVGGDPQYDENYHEAGRANTFFKKYISILFSFPVAICSLIAAIIYAIVAMMGSSLKRQQINEDKYVNEYHIINKQKHFIRTNSKVLHNYYSSQTSSGSSSKSGGGSFHSSSSGRSHGGGGRGF